MMTAVIEVAGLTKRYGDRAVVDGISFHVDEGEIFGILGPNGAGKTTAVECLEGLRRRDGGQVRILGLDPRADGHRLHRRIGVQLQETQLPEKLKVREALRLYASSWTRSRSFATVSRSWNEGGSRRSTPRPGWWIWPGASTGCGSGRRARWTSGRWSSASYRERGILRRLAVTPVRPLTLLVAKLVVWAASAALSAVLIVAVARLAFHVPVPAAAGWFVLALVLGVASLFALGMLAATAAPTARSAAGLGWLLFFRARTGLPRPARPPAQDPRQDPPARKAQPRHDRHPDAPPGTRRAGTRRLITARIPRLPVTSVDGAIA
jgi:ABC-type Fe3+/spermidine/putrescine transport system ATPase subunit